MCNHLSTNPKDGSVIEEVLYNNCPECNYIKNNCLAPKLGSSCGVCGYIYTQDDIEDW